MGKSLFKFWYIGYLVLLFAGVFYVNSVLKRDDIKVDEEKKDKSSIEEKIVKVDVSVNNGKMVKTYQTKLKNIDTVYDAFDEIREDNGFFYEITAYLNGTKVDCINDNCATDGYKWVVLKDKKDITSEIKNTSLEDDTLIEITLVQE